MKKTLVMCLFLAGCGTSPYQAEVNAYRDYLQAEINAGRLDTFRGNYLLQQKVNEVNSRQQADSANSAALGALGLSMMNAAGPRPIPQNSFNCQSYSTGPYTNTRCQ